MHVLDLAEHSSDEGVRAGSRGRIEPLEQDAGTQITFVLLVGEKRGSRSG